MAKTERLVRKELQVNKELQAAEAHKEKLVLMVKRVLRDNVVIKVKLAQRVTLVLKEFKEQLVLKEFKEPLVLKEFKEPLVLKEPRVPLVNRVLQEFKEPLVKMAPRARQVKKVNKA